MEPAGARTQHRRELNVKNHVNRLGQDERRWQETVSALDSVKAGRIVDGDDIMNWLATWGKKAEKKPPR